MTLLKSTKRLTVAEAIIWIIMFYEHDCQNMSNKVHEIGYSNEVELAEYFTKKIKEEKEQAANL